LISGTEAQRVATADGRPGLGGARVLGYSIHMKRTNLVLDESLLEEALRLSGERTYSRTVERALQDFVRRAKARRILELAGSGLWEGDLSVVREDRGVYRKRRGPR
jgi:Arc/MetJ family transcription regulator